MNHLSVFGTGSNDFQKNACGKATWLWSVMAFRYQNIPGTPTELDRERQTLERDRERGEWESQTPSFPRYVYVWFESGTFIKVTVVILRHEYGKLLPIVVINDRRQSLALNIVTWTHTQKVGKVSWHCTEGWVCCHGSKLGNVKTCKVRLRILYIKWHSWTNHGNNAFVNEILSCLKAKNNKKKAKSYDSRWHLHVFKCSLNLPENWNFWGLSACDYTSGLSHGSKVG